MERRAILSLMASFVVAGLVAGCATLQTSTSSRSSGHTSVDPRTDGFRIDAIEIELNAPPTRQYYSGEVEAVSPNGVIYVSNFDQNECVVRAIAGVIARYKNGNDLLLPLAGGRYGVYIKRTMFFLTWPEKGRWKFIVSLNYGGKKYKYHFTRYIGGKQHPHGWGKWIVPGTTQSD